MIKTTFSRINSLGNVLKRTMALVLVLALMLLVGCNDVGTSSEGSGTNSNNQSGNASVDETADINPLDGEISCEVEVQSVVARDDEGEIVPTESSSNLVSEVTGLADAEANALKNKILNTGNTEKYYNIKGTKYYISPGGDDTNPGTSPNQALRTVDGLTGVDLKEGDAVLFERDSVFRLNSSISTSSGIIYGSYGTGAKPKLYASGENFAEATWKPTQRKNIWYTSYIYDDAGTIVFDFGKEVGYKRTSIRNLSENLQFYQSEEDGYLYLYCDKGNPAEIYDSIEVTADLRIFYIPSRSGDVVIDNLCLMYSSSFAVSGNYNCHNVTVTNCEIGYIGGYTRSGGSTRLGNAIQMWTGIQGLTVENNWIYQTFDTAITWQGNGGEGFNYTDISIKNNLLEYNHTDIEFWDEGATLGDYNISDNIFRFTQLGWGARKTDGGIRGFDGVIYGTTEGMNLTGKITFKNNIIDSPGGRIFRWGTEAGDWAKYFNVSGTKLYITEKYRYDTQVIRNTYGSASTSDNLYATNASELKTAFQRIDPTIEVKWK